MVQLELYRSEIINFLRTVTIKFEPLAAMTFENAIKKGHEILTDKENPYYQNICGEYSVFDTPMYINSIDTDEQILFSKDNLKLHPKTAALYRIPNSEYDTLCQQYPNQVDLIKAIVYPAGDIQTVINAKNLTLLNYDTSSLYINERASILEATQSYIDMFRKRWYIPEFKFEEGYLPSLWYLFWNGLICALFAQRVHNIRTSSVHPFHIWEYLSSKGLDDYRAILTNDQALFLYRNMEYILKNKGKMSTLRILADNLLKDLRVSLVSKSIKQQTILGEDQCRYTPEIISESVVDYQLNKDSSAGRFESMSQIVQRMYDNKLEKDNSAEHIEKLEDTIGRVPQDYLPTKLLEIKKNTISTRYEELLYNFMLDTLMYRITTNEISFELAFKDSFTGLNIDLPVQELVALLYYATMRSRYHDITDPTQIPTYPPTIYGCYSTYKNKLPNTLPNIVRYKELQYRISQQVDISLLLSQIKFQKNTFKTHESFIDFIANQFISMVSHTREVRGSGNLLYVRSMAILYDEFLVRETLRINLLSQTTYEEWFNSNETLRALINQYNRSTDLFENYNSLADSIITVLFPTTHELLKPFVGIFDKTNILYDKLKDLFIQLCSYNIAFLDTSRAKNRYAFMTPTCMMYRDEMTYDRLDMDGSDFEVVHNSELKDIIPFEVYKTLIELDGVEHIDTLGNIVSNDHLHLKSEFEDSTFVEGDINALYSLEEHKDQIIILDNTTISSIVEGD